MFFSYMDGFSSYNQIKMDEEEKAKTTFTTHWGTYSYDVMPFSLKNGNLFHDMMHKEIKVYVADMISKSCIPRDHLIEKESWLT